MSGGIQGLIFKFLDSWILVCLFVEINLIPDGHLQQGVSVCPGDAKVAYLPQSKVVVQGDVRLITASAQTRRLDSAHKFRETPQPGSLPFGECRRDRDCGTTCDNADGQGIRPGRTSRIRCRLSSRRTRSGEQNAIIIVTNHGMRQ